MSNNDAVPVPGNAPKKNNKRGARHGPSERQRMYYKAEEMLHKAGQKKHGEHSSSLARWHSDYKFMLFDRIAIENHSHDAAKS